MYAVSTQYRQIQQRDLRTKSYVWVYLGIINLDAQSSASVSSNLAAIGSDDIFGSSRFEAYCVTCEEDFARVDGSMYFLPPDGTVALNQGAVTRDIMGGLTIMFSMGGLTIKGLTIDFGQAYPTAFTVTNGTQSYSLTNDAPGRFIDNDVEFTNTSYLTITPTAMVGGQQRMRVHSILFGIGFIFDNGNLLSTNRKNKIDHLSNALPEKSFTFTIDNRKQEFTQDNPDSYASYLEEQQRVEFTYGRELEDGSIYRIPGGVMALESWSSSQSEATFNTVGRLDYSTSVYFRGKYYPSGISLYDLAEDVFEDAGITEYRIDSYLSTLTTMNPLPIQTHKDCLKMIANAAEAILYEDRNGYVVIKGSFDPEWDITLQGETDFSNVDYLTSGEPVNYASGETDYMRVDGTQLFIQNLINPQNTGFVSDSANASITITFDAAWTFSGFSLEFGLIFPGEVIITSYFNSTVVSTTTYPVDGIHFATEDWFYDVDKLVITFDDIGEGQRVHVNKVFVGSRANYEVKYHDLQNVPVALSTEKVRKVYVKYYTFIYGNTEKTSVVTADIGDNLVTFSEAMFGYELDFEDGATGTLTLVESGAYYVIFTSSIAAKVKITGTAFVKAESAYSTSTINDKGTDKVLCNELISDSIRASKVAGWMEAYYTGDSEYNLSYRGEPALDCDDLIYLENIFVNRNIVRVVSEELSTGQGMSMTNNLVVRRMSYE